MRVSAWGSRSTVGVHLATDRSISETLNTLQEGVFHPDSSVVQIFHWPICKPMTSSHSVSFTIITCSQYRKWPMPKLEESFMKKKLAKWLQNPSFENLQKQLLVAYSQLVRDFGWGCIKEVMHSLIFSYYRHGVKFWFSSVVRSKERTRGCRK